MNESNPSDEGPVTDPQELERVMKLTLNDEGLLGPLMRLLLEARLWVYVPLHPELEGEHMMKVSDGFTWNTYRDEQGDFAAVFTSLRAAQEELRTSLRNQKKPAIVELPARVLFGFLNNGRTTVRILAHNGARIRLDPDGIRQALEGAFTEDVPPAAESDECEPMSLVPVEPENVPLKLRQAIRVFCTQRQGAIAVYVCHSPDKATGEVNDLVLYVLLRLRDNAGYFYNDFQIMAHKNMPKPYELFLAVPSAAQWGAPDMEFLREATPVWPVMHGRKRR